MVFELAVGRRNKRMNTKLTTYTRILATCFLVILSSLVGAETVTYGSYIGGSREDWGSSITMDSEGNTYIAGQTLSSDFPQTAGASAPSDQHPKGFVVKLDANKHLVYSTTFGGGWVNVHGIAADSDGNAYVAGTAYSEFPATPGAFDTTFTAVDTSNLYPTNSFLVKIDSTGNVAFSTFFGDNRVYAGDVTVDSNGYPYITGSTHSIYLPITAGAYQRTYAGAQWYPDNYSMDGFVAKFSKDGSGLIYSTYLGGLEDDQAKSVVVDGQGNAWVYGVTSTRDYYSVGGSYQPANSCAGFDWLVASMGMAGSPQDLFVAKLNPAGSKVSYSTYIGSCSIHQTAPNVYLWNFGGGEERAKDMAIDKTGNLYLSGTSLVGGYGYTIPFPYTNQTLGGNSFVMKISADGKNIGFASSFRDDGVIAVNQTGQIYLAGETYSDNFPIKNPLFDIQKKPYQTYPFLAKFDPSLAGPDALLLSTYVGSPDTSHGIEGIAVGQDGRTWIVGNTASQAMPVSADALIPAWLTPDVFNADFSYYPDVTGWPISGSGTWNLKEGELVGRTYKTVSVAAPAQSCNDCTISTNFTFETSGTKLRIFGWKKDSKNYVELEASSSGSLTLKHKSNGIVVAKKSTTNWSSYDVQLYANGKHLEVWSQNEKVIAIDSSQPVAATGNLGFQLKNTKSGQQAAVDIQQLQLTRHLADSFSSFVYEIQ